MLSFSLTARSHELKIKTYWNICFKVKNYKRIFHEKLKKFLERLDCVFSCDFLYTISDKPKPVYKRTQHFTGLAFSNENTLSCPSPLVFTWYLFIFVITNIENTLLIFCITCRRNSDFLFSPVIHMLPNAHCSYYSTVPRTVKWPLPSHLIRNFTSSFVWPWKLYRLWHFFFSEHFCWVSSLWGKTTTTSKQIRKQHRSSSVQSQYLVCFIRSCGFLLWSKVLKP